MEQVTVGYDDKLAKEEATRIAMEKARYEEVMHLRAENVRLRALLTAIGTLAAGVESRA